MKTIIIIVKLLFISSVVYGQTAIGKNSIDGDGLLDFGNDGKGIILPYVDQDVISNPSPGTFIFDTDSKQVAYYSSATASWISMNANLNDAAAPGIASEAEAGDGVVLGAHNATAEGVLVLESSDKALILPKVADPHENIKSPAYGTMCYDTTSKSIAVFNGKEWSYWK